jgi:cation transport ATPase
VDGDVTDGSAPDRRSIPVEKAAGDPVFASTLVQAGYLQLRATKVGATTTFTRIVRLVEDAESREAPVQKFAAVLPRTTCGSCC